MFEKIRPLYDRVLIKKTEEQEEKTASGIIISTDDNSMVTKGKVIATGEGHRKPDGNIIPLKVKVNDIVYFPKYAATNAFKEHIILREDEILGIASL